MPGDRVVIGRVGALAAALGVGVVIAGSAGVAQADPGDSGGASQSAQRSERPGAGPDKSDKAGPLRSTRTSGAASATERQRTGPMRTSPMRTLTVRTAQKPDRDAVTVDVDDDGAPDPADVAALAALGAARREAGIDSTPAAPAREPAAAARQSVVDAPAVTETEPVEAPQQSVAPQAVVAAQEVAASPLGTPQQLAAERLANRIAGSLPVKLVKLFLKSGFQAAAQRQFDRVGGPDQENLDRLDAAVNAYAMGAAYQQQLLNSAKPTVVMQVAPPHTWYGQTAGASRILYDNPDTIYRFMGVNGASSYVITGTFADLENLPADTSFSVLTGLTGITAAVLTKDQLVLNPDGSFTITADATPADGRANHLQLTADTTLIATRNTLSDWATQQPMTLEIERVGGPPNSLFSQLGGFAIPGIGPAVVRNPLLRTLVSLVPPLPHVPVILRGTVAAIIMAMGVQREETYMKVATTDPQTGQRIEPNVLNNPTRNAEFLATQLQSAGYFQLADDEALVITINPAGAGYFVVPVTDDWTITQDYWNQQTSLNSAQAEADPGGSYTIVVSPTDPGVANWVSTGGLNQGTISMRFQDIDPDVVDLPTVNARVVRLEDLQTALPPSTRYLTTEQREAQIAARKAAFDLRFAPYPQP